MPTQIDFSLHSNPNRDTHFLQRLTLIIALKTHNFGVSNQKWSQFQGDHQLQRDEHGGGSKRRKAEHHPHTNAWGQA